MDDIVLVITEKNEDAFNLFYELRNKYYAKNQYSIVQGAVFTKNGDMLEYKDGFNQHENGLSYLEGGLIGGLIGVLLGPFGVLLGTMVGISVAQYNGAKRTSETLSLFQLFRDQAKDGDYCLLLHVDEDDPLALDAIFARYPTKLIHRDIADEVYKEVTLAHEYKNEMSNTQELENEGKKQYENLGERAKDIEEKATSKAKELANTVSRKMKQLRGKEEPPQETQTPPAENAAKSQDENKPEPPNQQDSN